MNDNKYVERQLNSNGQISMVAHVLLLLFTFGIYYFYWIYKTTDFTNIDTKEPNRTPVCQLLLCLFVPFYFIYWTYKTSKRIDSYCRSNGIDCDITVLCTVLSIFIYVVSPIIIQDKINTVSDRNNFVTRGIQNESTMNQPIQNSSTTSSTNAMASDTKEKAQFLNEIEKIKILKKYKELLDADAISEIEFQYLKRNLFNIGNNIIKSETKIEESIEDFINELPDL